MASPTNVKIPKVTQYVRNVGKSVAFASINVIGNQMPGVKGFIEDNDEIFREAYHSVKNYKDTIRNVNKAIHNSNLYKAVEFGTKNMIEDAKSGNFYNKSRSTENAESILGLEDDMDFDYEIDDGSSNISSSKYLANSFDEAIGAAATGTTTAVARGTDIIVRSNKASTTMISSQIEKSTATLHSGLGAVYNSINVVNTFLAGPMTAHLENSRKYYENSLKIMQEQHAMTREMLEMQRNLYKAQDRTRSVSRIDQIMDYNGMPDLKAYKEIVKGNIDDILSMFNLGKNSGINLPMMIAAAPFMLLFEGLTETSIPKSIKRNLENLDSSLSSIFPNILTRIMNNDKRKSNNKDIDVKSILSQIFGIKIEKKDSINTSNYVKGAVPFDGITRKTIIEVIPGYLARIEAALTGSRERHYDPHKGTWRSIDEIDESFKSEKAKAVQMGNREVMNDLNDYRSSISDPKARKSFDRSVQKMLTRIFDDKGYFDPGLITEMNPEYTKDGKRVRHISDSADYKKYGFRSKEEFETVLSQLSNKTIQNLAMNNLRARQNYSRKLEQQEIDGGTYNLLFNGAYDPTGKGSTKKMDTSTFTSRNPLAAMTDTHGKNVFYYLREILNGINNRWRSREKTSAGSNYSYTETSEGYSTSREYSTTSESEGDSGSDSDDGDDDTSAWYRAEEDVKRDTKKKREADERKEKILGFASEKFNKSPLGKFFGKSIGNISHIFAKPVEFANELLEKANENVFALMFGNKELKDENGQPIDNILEYMINKVKTSFDELGKWIKNKFKGYFTNLLEKIQPKAQPVIDELKSMGRAAKARVGTAFKRTFDPAIDAILDRLPANVRAKLTRNEVVPTEEIVNNKSEDFIPKEIESEEDDSFQLEDDLFMDHLEGVDTRARGARRIKKRGLTMISPGEIIIPASFNKKEQNRMLAMEKRDRSKILKAIGLNAEGNVDTEQIKRNLHNIYEENKGTNKSSKTIASSIVGGGAGLLLGHPLIGAIAGAGISILNNSDTLKRIVFGEEINGEHREGLISKKIQDKFKTVLPDMGDYGIVGGVLGLLTPFGPLGGAAIGAGIGYLKHSEGFHKFIFGDEATGEEGLISEEAYKKFKEHVKKAAPNMLLGAVGGILAGPFGLLGNAALGAGVGLLSSTEGFHKFIFGDPEEGKGGVLDAFKTGFLDPAKDKFIEFLADFKKFAKRNIIDPMKDFWKPFNQMIKNTITGVGEKISDFVNDMFEKTVGLPLHDFLQEKIFKPVSKLVFGILKAPYTLGKAVIAAPFRALGGIGNTIRANQIRKGTAYDMSASERLAWRDQHWLRFNRFNRWKDKNYFQDNMMANMTDEQLEELSTQANAGLHSYATLQKNTGIAKKAVSEQISGYFNTKTEDGKNRFNRVKYNKVNDLTEIAQSGNLTLTNSYIDALEELTDEEKAELKQRIREKVQEANSTEKSMKYAKKGTKKLDKEISEIIGRKFRGRADRRKLYKNAEAELAARKSSKVNESPEVNATNNFAEIYKKKADTIITCFKTANEYLDNLVNPNKKDTRPPGDQEAINKAGIDKDTGNANIASEKSKENEKMLKEASKTIEDKNKKKKKGGKFWDGTIGGVVIDEDSKEASDLRKKQAEDEEEEAKNLKANEDQVSILSVIKDAIVGKDKQPKEETGFFGKVLKGLGKFGKFIGLTGLALTGVSLFGHATHWFKTSVWPDLKNLLFGSDDDKTDGLVGKLGTNIKKTIVGEDGTGGIYGSLKKLLYGENGNDGVLAKFGNFITDGINKITNWFTDKGGLQGLLINHVIPGFINGLGYAINYIVTPVTALIFKALPSLLSGLGKAILEGMKIAVFNKEVPNNNKRITIGDSTATSAIEQLVNSTGTAIESNDKSGVVSNIKGAFSGLAAAVFSSDPTIDLSSIFSKSNNSKNNKKSDGLLGALGQTKRTNEVEFDEDGNAITDYTRWNTTDSFLSKGAKAVGRGFLKGLAGGAPNRVVSDVGTGAIKSAANILKPGIGNKVKGIAGLTTSAAKGALNATSTSTGIGNTINQAIANAAEYKGKFLDTTKAKEYIGKYVTKNTKPGKYVGKYLANSDAATSKGIIAGIKRIFSKIADSSICKKILNSVNTFTNKNVSEKIIKEAIEKIGDKLGDSILAKATKVGLKSVSNIIAKFSFLQLIQFGIDFAWGVDNAHTMLGITIDSDYDVTTAHKCVCGLVNMLTKFFTLGLVSGDTVMDIVIEVLFPIFGLTDENLEYARKVETDAIMDSYNEANIDNPDMWVDNVQDYNNKDKWWYKTSKKFSATYNDVKTVVSTGIETAKEGLSHVGDSVSTWFNNFVTGAKTLTPLVGSAMIKHIQKAWDFNNEVEIDDSLQTTGDETLDKIGNVIYGIGKYYTWFITYPGTAIKVIKNAIESIIDGTKAISKVVGSGISNTIERAKEGSLSGITSTLNESTGNKMLDLIANTIFGVSKIYTTPIALLVSGFTNLKSAFNNIVSKWSAAKSTKASDDSKINRAINGSLSVFSTTYWKNADHSNEGIMGAIVNVQTYLEKIINAPVAIIRNVINTITNSLDSIKNLFGSGKLKSVWDWVTGFFTEDDEETTPTKRTTTKTIIPNSGFGRGRKFGKAHIYQSGAVADIPYGDSTIGDAGCAPVAATNLLNSLGINSSLEDAATFAEANGMTVRGGGTDIDYFNHYLGSKGIVTKSTNSRNDVMNALRNGDQVVMLGRDSTDGYGTPFGTDPHFVTAKGISKSGNIIAEDPDLPDRYVEYKPGKMMNSMISSVIADTGIGRNRKLTGRGKYGLGAAEVAMLDEYTVTSTFDEYRDNSIGKHGALDLVKYNNAPIYAFTNGTVKYTNASCAPDSGYYGSTAGDGFGNYVTIVDDDNYYHTYAHLNGVSVSPGEIVNRGDKIGIQGHTGSSTGSHLHYQIAKGSVTGTKQNPKTYLQNYDSSSNDNSAYWDNEDSYDDYYDSSNSDSSSSSSSSSNTSEVVTTITKPTLFSALTNLGKSIARYLYGDAYNTIHGFSDTNTAITYPSSSSDNSSNNSNNDSSSSSYDDDYYYDDSSSSNSSYPSDSSSSSNSTVSDHTGTINKTYITSLMWKKFREEFGLTEAGAAGMMGNINAESAFKANNLQDTFNTKFGVTDEQYTDQVNKKSRSKSSFINDGAGYGYAQWTWGPRKEGLYNMSVENGVDIGAPYIQLDYINKELTSNYNDTGNILRSTNNVNTASDRVLRSYEAPADPESKLQTRRNYSWAVYNTYKGTGRSDSNLHKYKTGSAAKTLNDMSRTANVINNNYYGSARDTVDYATFLKTIVEILITISNNTSMLNKIVEILSSKFDITIDPNEVKSAATNANTRAQAERRINEMIESNNNLADRARILNNKDTSYLLSAMTAIAAE